MKHGSTIFLRLALFGIGFAVLALYVFVLPRFAYVAAEKLPEYACLRYSAVIGLYATALPFYFALYRTLMLLGFIDRNDAFSGLSVMALRDIKHCAIAVSILLMAALPFVYVVADTDDAPGLMVIGLIIAFAPLVIATFAAVLQKLLKEVIEIKSENDAIMKNTKA